MTPTTPNPSPIMTPIADPTAAATTARRPKQTAGNNPALARIRAAFNGPIYRECSRLMNEGGAEAVRAYLRTLYRAEYCGKADAMVDGE